MAALLEAWRWWLALGAVVAGCAAAVALWRGARGRHAQRRSAPTVPYRRPLESLFPHQTPLTDPAAICSVCGQEIGPWYMWRRIHRNKVAHTHAKCADAAGMPLDEPPATVSARRPQA